MSIESWLIACITLLAVGGLWFLMYYFGNPVVKDPDGSARVEGNCGDTMEIAIKVREGKIVGSHFWTNGCSYSKQCVEAATILAHGQNIDQVAKINMISIMERIGQLPETHLHCAQLAEITLQRSLADYLHKSNTIEEQKVSKPTQKSG